MESPDPEDPRESLESKDSSGFLDCRVNQVWVLLVHQALKGLLVFLGPKEIQETRGHWLLALQDRPEPRDLMELKENQENQEYPILWRVKSDQRELKV